MRSAFLLVLLVWLTFGCTTGPSVPEQGQSAPFRFESVATLEEMRTLLRQRFAIGADRADLRRTFVDEGRATLVGHPVWRGVEKYIYDINLCSYYIWRWNISADYDAAGRLEQVYMNGEVILADGTPERQVPEADSPEQAIFKVRRERPEAYKGETSVPFAIYDLDGNLDTIDDQFLIGPGPTQAIPEDLGQLYFYGNVDPWRSIFDRDDANFIASYSRDCSSADEAYREVLERRPGFGI